MASRWNLRSTMMAIFVVVSAVALSLLGRLYTDTDWRHKTFASLLNVIVNSSSPEMMALRCKVVADAQGKVLEVGPGTGVNFMCLKDNNLITEWVGVEPNPYMASYIHASAKNHAVPFSISIINNSALAMPDIADDSVDTVISTHVLCSVEDTDQALREIRRVLKPGGRFLFLEHVAADPNQHSYLRQFQAAITPVWRIIADGCEFRPTWTALEQMDPAFATLQYQNLSAPMPFVVKPHIAGVATK